MALLATHGPSGNASFFLKKWRPREIMDLPLVTQQSLLVPQHDIVGF